MDREARPDNVRRGDGPEQVDSTQPQGEAIPVTHLSRREFVSGLAAAVAVPHPMRPARPLPPASRWAARPVAVASANGLRGVQKAAELVLQGIDPLDAAIEGVKIQELDPKDMSVGYGGLPNGTRPTGTVNLDVVTPTGDIASVTTTSGLAWKIPGRVGDSAIIGAGQYTDNDVGAAGSIGRGESNIKVCGGFLTVEFMRRGMKPTDACLEALKRVVTTTEPRLLGESGRPRFDLSFFAVNKRGEFGGASLYPSRFAAFDGTGAKLADAASVFEGRPPR